ncbi:NAD(P)/FAD-dependent oxidoreductase [Canibacter sp. lx-45]|uniref:NAD(P)/FAD-dependent oxidoreductase n=1 Tax=Canibacter zhuwentaonis TaxID=2837491 RepID=UPI001BDCDE86|nr:NAD(P)/FAD-dependent oxidoreductase [Canibacter zhuwentaonis]MBT1034806.1 NAD(P)/FAD-dependent oxidoreductase [Canibacter zhuwentaonis]
MTKEILIVGGGYAGFYTAWHLEKHLRRGEANVTIVDPLPYMQYLPFLPEVAAGSIEPRHAVVSRRRHLRNTAEISGKVVGIRHADKLATIELADGSTLEQSYDEIVITTGSVSRTFPIPGIADNAIGMKTIEEAAAVRDRLFGNFERAAALPKGSAERERLLTVTVVGGGFAGIETIAELRSAANDLLSRYPEIDFAETSFHLVEAMGRIMPEVSQELADWVIKDQSAKGVTIHLDTQLQDATGGQIKLSTGEEYPSDLIIWTAGVMPRPFLRNTDLPIGSRGHVISSPTLQVTTENGEKVLGAWTAGDTAQTPDISETPGPGGFCVPNAQHAVRQGKLLARNITAQLRGEGLFKYNHKNLGAVAGLGLNTGVFQSGKVHLTGYIAWLAHRLYHGMAIPTWERKARVFGGWVGHFIWKRDGVGIEANKSPRAEFERFAARPKS